MSNTRICPRFIQVLSTLIYFGIDMGYGLGQIVDKGWTAVLEPMPISILVQNLNKTWTFHRLRFVLC